MASVLQGHTNVVTDTHFTPSGHLLATMSWDGSGRLWDAAAGDPLITMPVLALLGFSPDGRRLAFLDGLTLGLWDLSQGQEVRGFNPCLIGNRTEIKDYEGVRAAQFSPDSRLEGLATRDGVHLYDALSGRELARLKAGICETLFFDSDGRSLITFERPGSVPLADPSRP